LIGFLWDVEFVCSCFLGIENNLGLLGVTVTLIIICYSSLFKEECSCVIYLSIVLIVYLE